MTKYRITYFAIFLTIILSNILLSQPKEGETLDKIIAIVGNEIIMQSDVTGQIAQLCYANPKIKSDDPAVYQQVLDALINEKLVVTKALEDSIFASEDEIEQHWQYVLKQYIQMYGSEKRLEDVFGMSISQIKREMRAGLSNQIVFEKIRQQKFSNVSCSNREVEEFFNIYKDSIPNIPQQIELFHIVKYVKAKTSTKDEVYNLAKNIRDSLLSGANFADFAIRYSNDAATANSGGDFGWIERGKVLPEIEKIAFAQQIGQISLPVETPFGYHIIETINKEKDRVSIRHILFRIGQSDEDIQAAKQFLIDLKNRAQKGQKFEDLAILYSDDKETAGFGGSLGKFEIAKIPDNFRSIFQNAPDSTICEPIAYNSDPSKPAFHIVYKKKTYPEHKPNLKDDFKEIQQFALSYKQNKMYLEWVQELRKQIYWEYKGK